MAVEQWCYEDGRGMWGLSVKELGCNSYSSVKVGKYYVNSNSKWVLVTMNENLKRSSSINNFKHKIIEFYFEELKKHES